MKAMITVFSLPTCGGQPTGNIIEEYITVEEYNRRKAVGEYIYTDYIAADYRARD